MVYDYTMNPAVKAKIAGAPRPSPVAATRNKLQVLRSRRAGGELRGNAYDRRRRISKLLHEFGDGTAASCWMCGTELTAQTLTQDKIFTTMQGGRYVMANLLPACKPCNQTRGERPIR